MSMWYLYALTVLGVAITQFTIFFPYQRKALIRWFKNKLKRKPKYKVGQKVRVRGDLIKHKDYGSRTVYISMMRHVGSVVTIDAIHPAGKENYYSLKEDWEDNWTIEMFEPFKIKKEDAFEALLHGHIDDEEYKAIMNVGGVVNYVRSWRNNRTHR